MTSKEQGLFRRNLLSMYCKVANIQNEYTVYQNVTNSQHLTKGLTTLCCCLTFDTFVLSRWKNVFLLLFIWKVTRDFFKKKMVCTIMIIWLAGLECKVQECVYWNGNVWYIEWYCAWHLMIYQQRQHILCMVCVGRLHVTEVVYANSWLLSNLHATPTLAWPQHYILSGKPIYMALTVATPHYGTVSVTVSSAWTHPIMVL